MGVSFIFVGVLSYKMGASTPTLSYNSPPMQLTLAAADGIGAVPTLQNRAG